MTAIIVVAYSRPVQTRRLMDSLVDAKYDGDNVDLILSIDKSENQQQVYDACADIVWPHGEYKIIKREKRMGLRPHILSCGEMTSDYDGVIVLEDDLSVGENFYRFAKSALKFYGNDERVAQISLYSYGVNEFVSRPFIPQKNEYDAYAMQVTQSWGECWSKEMWQNFMASPHYGKELEKPRKCIPHNVNCWGKSSWKKNFTNYLADSGRYVIYPYISHTTNYTCAGEHSSTEVSDYHVPIQYGDKKDYFFGILDNCIKYDMFFERVDPVIRIDGLEDKKVCMDLYGLKKDYEDADVLISVAEKKYRVIKKLKLQRKPHEENLRYPEEGNGIFVYDLSVKEDKAPQKNVYAVARYDIGSIRWQYSANHARTVFKNKLKSKLFGKK